MKSEPTSFEEVTFQPKSNTIDVKPQRRQAQYSIGYPNNYEPQLVNTLQRNHVPFNAEGTGGSSFLSILTYILPFILFFGFWVFLMNQMQGGGSRVMSFGKSRAKRMSVDAPKITFRDVAGVDEAVQELHEIKEFLENPKRFQALGARIPKGVLLYGPPGTGKTLLARAVAGEAGVPFFSISGSDFVEMFVGVGASRVRDLFEQAKQNSPCIIFMDEIDAVGRHRGAGMGGGHDEREQTLNQLLVEMDGFEMKDNIILIAATNRPDILDPALLRPGRFDRQIVVDRPDRKGRKQILEVHTRGKPLAKQIDLDALAGQTPGFTGADLANLINEAALLTARSSKREITMDELEEGIMRVIAGPEKKSRVMSEKERLVTAYHELGHAIVGHLLPNTDPVHKISIISRGQALGYTISLPTEDKFLTTRAELTDTMAMTLGGRAAEEIIFGEITTGASNDLEKVTETAKQMVMRYGMSERLGPRVFGHDRSHAVPGPRVLRRARLLGRDRARDRRRDPPHRRGGPPDREGHPRRAPRGPGPDLEDPARARDDRRRAVREAARGQPPRTRSSASRRRSRRRPSAPPEPEKKAGREGPRPVPRPRPGFAGSRRDAFRRAGRPGPSELTRAQRAAHRGPRRDTGPGGQADGNRQRDPRLVLGRGAVPGAGAGDRARAAARRRGRRPARRRRGVDPARRARRLGGRGARAGRSRCSRGCATRGAPISIDTSKVAVAEVALDAGAEMVNDVTALRVRARARGALRRARLRPRAHAHAGHAAHDAGGPDATMTSSTTSRASWRSGSSSRPSEGVAEERIWIDPGIGFGKTVEHNLELLRRLGELASSAGRSWSAPPARASSASSRAARSVTGSAARSPPTCWRCSAERRCSACTTSPSCGRRSTSPRRSWAVAPGRGESRRARRRGGIAVRSRPVEAHREGLGLSGSVEIEVRGLSIYTHHGVTEAEREIGQRLEIDVSFDVPDCDAVLTDRLEDTVDYAEVCDIVALAATERSYKTLERLCHVIGERLMERFACESVRVRATKPEPPLPLAVSEVAVEVVHERPIHDEEEEPD